jgi:hypothetical protein
MRQFEDDPVYPHLVVLKCLAALLLVVIVAAGPWIVLATNDQSTVDVPGQPGQPTERIAEGDPSSVTSTE